MYLKGKLQSNMFAIVDSELVEYKFVESKIQEHVRVQFTNGQGR